MTYVNFHISDVLLDLTIILNAISQFRSQETINFTFCFSPLCCKNMSNQLQHHNFFITTISVKIYLHCYLQYSLIAGQIKTQRGSTFCPKISFQADGKYTCKKSQKKQNGSLRKVFILCVENFKCCRGQIIQDQSKWKTLTLKEHNS